MAEYILFGFLALVAFIVVVATLLNIPAILRYGRIRSDSRDKRPMGITTTPRSHVVGP